MIQMLGEVVEVVRPHIHLYNKIKKLSLVILFLILSSQSHAQIFSDGFNVADSTTTNLDEHTPETGTGWTEIRQIDDGTKETPSDSELNISAVDDAGLNIDVALATESGTLSEGSLYTADATYTSADYVIEVTMPETDGFDDYCWIAARVQDEDNMYLLRFNGAGSALYVLEADSETELDTASGIADDSKVEFIIEGTSLSVEDDDVEILSATNSTFSSAGKAGIGMGEVFSGGTGDHNGNACSFDYFIVTAIEGEEEAEPEPVNVFLGSGTWGNGSF